MLGPKSSQIQPSSPQVHALHGPYWQVEPIGEQLSPAVGSAIGHCAIASFGDASLSPVGASRSPPDDSPPPSDASPPFGRTFPPQYMVAVAETTILKRSHLPFAGPIAESPAFMTRGPSFAASLPVVALVPQADRTSASDGCVRASKPSDASRER